MAASQPSTVPAAAAVQQLHTARAADPHRSETPAADVPSAKGVPVGA